MKKSRSLHNLVQLYLSYHLNKVALILLGAILFLWCIVLILNSGFPIDPSAYLLEYKTYHFNYLEQSLFFLQMIDAVIVAFLIGAEMSSLDLFDPMFVPNTARIKLIFAKLLVNTILLMSILLLQVLLLEWIGVLIFPNYVVKATDLLVIFYLLFPLLELMLLGELISMILKSYFIPILIFIIQILLIILLRTDKISQILSYFIPKIGISFNEIRLIGNIPICLSICFLLVIAIALAFQKKDISI